MASYLTTSRPPDLASRATNQLHKAASACANLHAAICGAALGAGDISNFQHSKDANLSGDLKQFVTAV
jgi:hypothetical protein